MDEQYMQVVMNIIMYAGNAKGLAHEALTAAKNGDLDKAKDLMEQSNQALSQAHDVQTDLLTKEAQGEHTDVNLYMVHAQDHLMNAITYRDLVGEFIELYQHVHNTEA
ncbi:PTS system cellobiose-specific IIA component [Weissella uvarum]|uniref:PTS lactose/cellobiose transporter subunit IIA n=1 Tax=Weissella uvarum TaxID=1479233 RepID=UPI001961466E|nr:PTS lactose/cellobiose transporter subunit IIA [Weissella uvarum]MBM7616570.1 PTS system cellobiose-specific IIA component [Weissella uvarum]MCM0594970.1 PTS lactose/cellobiose transporter subunit IIA [Weissella uvarum]